MTDRKQFRITATSVIPQGTVILPPRCNTGAEIMIVMESGFVIDEASKAKLIRASAALMRIEEIMGEEFIKYK